MIVTKENWTLKRLRGVPLMKPELAGDRWKGIPHHDLVQTWVRSLEPLHPSSPIIVLSKDLQDVAASVLVEGSVEGHRLSVGILSSNARRFALRTYGGVVTPDGVGAPLFALTPRYRHERIDYDAIMQSVLTSASRAFELSTARREQMQGRAVQRELAEHYVMESNKQASPVVHGNVLSSSRAMHVLQKLQSPTISAWDLYLHFCHQNVKATPLAQMEHARLFRCRILGESSK